MAKVNSVLSGILLDPMSHCSCELFRVHAGFLCSKLLSQLLLVTLMGERVRKRIVQQKFSLLHEF